MNEISEEGGAEEVVENVENKKAFKVNWTVVGGLAGGLLVLGGLGFLLWFCLFVSKIENWELGYTFDKVSGEVEKIDKKGWVIRTPVRYGVHRIDLRPHQITISAYQKRVLNAKLVQFNPAGLDTFVVWHGRGAGDDLNDLLEILKCYAFDPTGGKDCPFLTVVQEITPNQTGMPLVNKELVGGGK